MAPRRKFSGWSIEVAPGWTAETREELIAGERGEFLAIVSENHDALLRLTPDERSIMSAVGWVETVGKINRSKGRRVSATRCGDFAGYAVEFSTSDEWIRGWVLSADLLPLDVTYRCKVENAGRDDLVIERMLDTLRLEKDKQAVKADE